MNDVVVVVNVVVVALFNNNNNNAVYYKNKMVRQICTIANSHLTITGPARGFSIYNPFFTLKVYMFHMIGFFYS